MAISRPPGFKFKAGDYLFIKIPSLAKYEYHPFTISSAPELQGTYLVIIPYDDVMHMRHVYVEFTSSGLLF